MLRHPVSSTFTPGPEDEPEDPPPQADSNAATTANIIAVLVAAVTEHPNIFTASSSRHRRHGRDCDAAEVNDRQAVSQARPATASSSARSHWCAGSA